MKLGKSIAGLFAAAVVACISTISQGAFSYTPLGDSGTLTVTTYSPTLQVASASVASPYGTPVITPVASGYKLTFTPSSNFFAAANSFGGGKTSEMTGKLDFLVTFDSAVQLTLNVYEDGLFSKSGSGIVGVAGGAVVAEAFNAVSTETHANGNLAGGTTFNAGAGSWSSFLQVTGFTGAFTTYKISIDNDLLAEALATNDGGTAAIAKKNFAVILTTDGSTGGGPNVPEPASLGILAIGGLALVARRRS